MQPLVAHKQHSRGSLRQSSQVAELTRFVELVPRSFDTYTEADGLTTLTPDAIAR